MFYNHSQETLQQPTLQPLTQDTLQPPLEEEVINQEDEIELEPDPDYDPRIWPGIYLLNDKHNK